MWKCFIYRALVWIWMLKKSLSGEYFASLQFIVCQLDRLFLLIDDELFIANRHLCHINRLFNVMIVFSFFLMMNNDDDDWHKWSLEFKFLNWKIYFQNFNLPDFIWKWKITSLKPMENLNFVLIALKIYKFEIEIRIHVSVNLPSWFFPEIKFLFQQKFYYVCPG